MSQTVDGEIVAISKVDSENVGVLMRRATDVAGVCRDIVLKTAQSIQGRKYVRVEGWQSIAVAYGCAASARDVEVLPDGVRAVGEVRRMSDGAVIATGEGFVGNDEPIWSGGGLNPKTGKPYEARPMYARRAMAQTRAISRACRSAFAFVVTMIDGGLETTPAEEMIGVYPEADAPPPPPAGVEKLRAVASKPSPPRKLVIQDEPKGGNAEISKIPPGKPTHDGSMSFGFGRSKGVPIAQLDEGSLRWYSQCLNKDLSDPSKAQWHDKTRQQLSNLTAELVSRGLTP